jgi:hypothetical protein
MLKDILTLLGQGEMYVVVDALDECSKFSGYPSHLMVVHEPVDLHFTRKPEKSGYSRLYRCKKCVPGTEDQALLLSFYTL